MESRKKQNEKQEKEEVPKGEWKERLGEGLIIFL